MEQEKTTQAVKNESLKYAMVFGNQSNKEALQKAFEAGARWEKDRILLFLGAAIKNMKIALDAAETIRNLLNYDQKTTQL